jgi:ATP-dependent protease HslVU (ClpYQ) peptidase subunit
MTTIAYKDGIIAVDSRTTSGSTISSDRAQKIFYKDGVCFVLGGQMNLVDDLINSWPDLGIETENIGGFAWDGEKLWEIVCSDEKLTKQKHDVNEPWACGTGGDFALGALDMGATAEEAVKIAIGRDIYSGGEVKTVRIG